MLTHPQEQQWPDWKRLRLQVLVELLVTTLLLLHQQMLL
jgi:hypothetical protein